MENKDFVIKAKIVGTDVPKEIIITANSLIMALNQIKDARNIEKILKISEVPTVKATNMQLITCEEHVQSHRFSDIHKP